MTKINNMRAKLLFEKFYQDEETLNISITFARLVDKVLTIPSYFEIECCTEIIQNIPILYLNGGNLNLSNMEQVIEDNFAEIPLCSRCKKKPKFKIDFANHIFIEVIVKQDLNLNSFYKS